MEPGVGGSIRLGPFKTGFIDDSQQLGWNLGRISREIFQGCNELKVPQQEQGNQNGQAKWSEVKHAKQPDGRINRDKGELRFWSETGEIKKSGPIETSPGKTQKPEGNSIGPPCLATRGKNYDSAPSSTQFLIFF